jgi:hypothetical protein
VPVQMHDKRGKIHQAYLWQYSAPKGTVLFGFRMGRGREGPKEFLGRFTGILQTDGYVAYEGVGGTGMVHAACWAHARRKIFDAVKLSPGDQVARQLVERVDDLFEIDAEAREAGMDHAQRDILREERSRPLTETIKTEMQAAQFAALPSSTPGKAVACSLTLWHQLTRFLEYPEIELSTNLAENPMRPVALGRKNRIHIGSGNAGPKVAAIRSVVESCRRLGLPVRDYLGSVLPRTGQRSHAARWSIYADGLGRFPSLIPFSRLHFQGLPLILIDGVALTLTVFRATRRRSMWRCEALRTSFCFVPGTRHTQCRDRALHERRWVGVEWSGSDLRCARSAARCRCYAVTAQEGPLRCVARYASISTAIRLRAG